MFEAFDDVRLYRRRGRPRCGFGPPWANRSGWEPLVSENPVDALATGMTPNLRASDDERAAVSEALTRHHLDGRLDIDEYTKRLEVAYGAKTRGELAPLLVDLPPDVRPSQPGRTSPRGLWLVVPFFAFAMLVTLTVVTGHPFILGGWWILLAMWFWWRSRPVAPTGSRDP